MGKGEIVGENFFNASIWTVTLTAQQQTSISVLKLESLAGLEQRMPGIESRLIDYYSRSSDIYAEMKKKAWIAGSMNATGGVQNPAADR